MCNGQRILIVEDSATQAERLQLILKEHGFQTAIARNGEEALARLPDFAPHLVVSDIIMPVMDGFELCRRIKSDTYLEQLPVLLLTALAEPKDVLRGLECGATNFLVKPYDETGLLQRVNSALAGTAYDIREAGGSSVDILFEGEHFSIDSSIPQVLGLLLSIYEAALQKQSELLLAREESRRFAEQLEEKVVARTHELQDEVAERRKAEFSLRSTEQMLQSITDGISDCITLISTDYRILWLNAAALRSSGAARAEDVIGRSCFDVHRHPDGDCRASASDCPIACYLTTGDPATRTHVHLTLEGEPYPCEIAIHPIRDDRGILVSFIHVSRDLTDRLRFEENLITTSEELRRLDRMKSEFISVASHELRTPLASIKNAVDIVLKRKAGTISPTQERFLHMAERNVTRLTALIEDILDISRIESGRMEPNIVKADIREIIDNVIDTLAPLAQAKSIAIEGQTDGDLPQVYLDPAKIEQILLNLAGNAVKFAPARGTVRIAAKLLSGPAAGIETTEYLEVAVEDDGVGISAANMEHVFDKFFQVEDTLSGRQPGTGLGLAIAKGLVEQHGGELKCASKEGEGCTFTMTLPIRSQADVFNSTLEHALAAVLAKHEQMTLLVISVNEYRSIREASEDDRETLTLAIRTAVAGAKLRGSDVVKVSSQTGEVVLILPETDPTRSGIVRDRVIKRLPTAFAAGGGDPMGLSYACRMANYPLDARSPRDLLQKARP